MKTELILYRLERSQESFDEALLMAEQSHWNTCANRLYYSCFYAVSALLEMNELRSSKHSGVKALFNKHFIKTGVIEKSFGGLFNELFDARQEGDYVDFVRFTEDQVKPWISRVQSFIETINTKLC